jgi:parallel beta-helix repeat protein
MLLGPKKTSGVCLIVLLFSLFSVSQVCWAQEPDYGLIIIREDGSINCDGLPDLSVIPIQQQGDIYTLTENIQSYGPGISIMRSGITIDGAGFILRGRTGETHDSSAGVCFSPDVCEVTVKNLTVTDFASGLVLTDNSRNVFVGNNVSDNLYNGFYFSGTCRNNTISENTISDNPRWGFILLGREPLYGGPSTGNNIIGNTFENNGWEKWTIPSYGMDDDYGAGVWLFGAINNTFYGNKFVNNAQQAFIFDHAKNEWSASLPSGGNYWSDYNGVDADDDGIGDSPYVIDDANSDPHPLVPQSSAFAPSEEDENEVEQQSQIPVEYIIALAAAVAIISLSAYVYRKRIHSKAIR